MAVAPGTWWENPGQEARLSQRRCADAGWTLEVPAAAMGRWRRFSGADTSRRAQSVHASTGGDAAQWQRLVSLLRGEPLPPLVGEGWVSGVATGPLVVCNLTVATSLIGTPWFPSLVGSVLLLEDVGEAPYRVDRMLPSGAAPACCSSWLAWCGPLQLEGR